MKARKVQLSFSFDVFLRPVAKAEGVLLRAAQRVARKLDLGDARGGLGDQRVVDFFTLRHALQLIHQFEDRVSEISRCASKIRIMSSTSWVCASDVSGCDVPASRSIMRSCAEPPAGELVAASSVFTPSRPPSNTSRSFFTLAKRAENCRKRAIRIGGSDGALPVEDLPKSYQCLQRAGCVGPQAQIVDLVDGLGGVQELIDGCVRNVRTLPRRSDIARRRIGIRAPGGPRSSHRAAFCGGDPHRSTP